MRWEAKRFPVGKTGLLVFPALAARSYVLPERRPERVRTFKDNKGREWNVLVGVNELRRVRQLVGVDLMQVVEGHLAEELAKDPVRLCDVLYALCQPQADAQHISDVEFGEGLAGDAIERAVSALLDALVDFFPSRQGSLLRLAREKMQDVTNLALDMAKQNLEAIEPMLPASGDKSMSAPESSDAIPAP